MKRFIIFLIALLMSTSAFGEVREVSESELVRVLEKNRSTKIAFVTTISLAGLTCDSSNNVNIPIINSKKIKIKAEIPTELLHERINYKKEQTYKVCFVLRDVYEKVYGLTRIYDLESVLLCKARLEEEKRIAEEKRLEEERIAEEKRLEAERIAEEKRLEEERIAEEKRQRNAKFLPLYEGHLAKAKQYEAEKRWCFALGSYYDAMGVVDLDPEFKKEAVLGYKTIVNAILSGNPGLGTFNVFTLHDEWKNLLIDAEKYGSSIPKFSMEIGELIRGDLDYQTKTASYHAIISVELSSRYVSTILIIEKGYEKAFKDDWKSDLPAPFNWPAHSVSYKNDGIYNVDGALIFGGYSNAWDDISLYELKVNIVNEFGKEVVKGKRALLEKYFTFDGITPEVVDLIDNGKAFINPVAVYLQYGKSNRDKNFSVVALNINDVVFYGKNFNGDTKHENVKTAIYNETLNSLKLVEIPNKNYLMSTTEVTIDLYEAVMGAKPEDCKDASDFPVAAMFYDAIYFCNKLSEKMGYTPVYSVDGKTDVASWDYKPNESDEIFGEIKQNLNANGFRLPTKDEWEYAVKGGEEFKYAGSDILDEVAWCNYNEERKKNNFLVGQKKANAYGLYDMLGNEPEWCLEYGSFVDARYRCGGVSPEFDEDNYLKGYDLLMIEPVYMTGPYSYTIETGIRLVRTKTE